MGILLIAAAIYLIFSAFSTNVYMGIIVTAALLIYGYFKWYPALCIIRAKNIYKKDAEGALKWFSRVEKRMNINQLEIYAYYLMREGQVEKSEAIYEKLLKMKLKPDVRLKVRADYAVLLTKTGRIDEAIAELEEVTLNYRNTITYGSLGYLYILKDNIRKAVNYNLEAYDYNSDDPVILDNIVQLYIKLGEFNKAKSFVDKLLEKTPYFAEAYYDSAFVYMKLGNFKKAEELLEDAKCCKLTFMSTVKESDLDRLEKAIKSKDAEDFQHKLGKFSGEDEITEEETLNLPELEDDEETEENEYDDDPFI